MVKHGTVDEVVTRFMLILLCAIDCKIVVLGWKGIFKCHNHRGIEEEKWKCHWLTSCLTDLLHKWKIHLGGKKWKDNGMSREMMMLMLREPQNTWRRSTVIIITVWINEMCFPPAHTLQHVCWIILILQIFIYIPYGKGAIKCYCSFSCFHASGM